MKKVALGIFAHPDDAEFMCTGTLSLLKKSGWKIHLTSLATGDKGTNVYSREEIINIRKQEAKRAADVIGAVYHCLGMEDLYIFYDRNAIDKTTEHLREVRPAIVFTSSPTDYMLDHEITSQIVQTACFSAGIKNIDIVGDPFEPIPWLYYCDPMEGKDKYGAMIQPSIYVDIAGEIDTKEKMLICHESQRKWLLDHHNVDEYVMMMKRFTELRGKEINIKYAEGFRQHLGHSFPCSNILKEVLGDCVKTVDTSCVSVNHKY
ncbi:MAG: PIG-L deacetylase family protein [Bacteroidales bacterium]